MISRPSQLTAFLQSIALHHPLVEQVITGEGSRGEASTRSSAIYPQVRIETPSTSIPLDDGQKKMFTRLFVIHAGTGESEGKDDVDQDLCYRIAESLIHSIQSSADDSAFDISLVSDPIQLDPIVGLGSDQSRGWTFEVGVLIEKDSCSNEVEVDDLFVPGFSWENTGTTAAPEIDISDETLGDADLTWYWEEASQQTPATEFDYNEGIEISEVDELPYRLIHVWLKAEKNDVIIWSYALIDSRLTKGSSVPHIPKYPA